MIFRGLLGAPRPLLGIGTQQLREGRQTFGVIKSGDVPGEPDTVAVLFLDPLVGAVDVAHDLLRRQRPEQFLGKADRDPIG